MQRMYGTSRPDIWEMYGGHAAVSHRAWRQGWLTLQPCDHIYETDLHDPAGRSEVFRVQREMQPRLLLIEFPQSYWINLSRYDYHKNSQRQHLKGLREKQRPFAQLAASLASNQQANGDMYLIEQPLLGARTES